MKTNNVQLVGYVGNHLNSMVCSSGDVRTAISLATHYRANASDENKKLITVWHRVVAWRNVGTRMAENLVKGSRVLIDGHLTYYSYIKNDGTRCNDVVITVNSFMNLDR
jgi:single stranded DNA-binding protein